MMLEDNPFCKYQAVKTNINTLAVDFSGGQLDDEAMCSSRM